MELLGWFKAKLGQSGDVKGPVADDVAGSLAKNLVDAGDDWGSAAYQALEKMDSDDRAAWLQILAYASTANAVRPTAAWLKRARAQIAELSEQWCKDRAFAWLDMLSLPSLKTTYRDRHGQQQPSAVIAERNADLLKGLVWLCSLFHDGEVARTVGDAAIASFKKIPDIGARSTKVGNACLYALGAMPGMNGVVQLQRVKQKVKYPSAQRLIDSAFENAARRLDLSREDLDELAAPTFGLEDGRIRQAIGSYTAEIAMAGYRDLEIRWLKSDGTLLRTEPGEVKRGFPDELRALKRTTKDIRNTLSAQRDRVEQLLRTPREWALRDWRERYLDHPLLSLIARRLIWWFQEGDHTGVGAWCNGEIVDESDRRLDWLADETRVRLWHPIGFEPDVVLAWRLWLEGHEVTQPFKQAHREVYILTDAELATNTYSNRFAAHLLRQHQFHALCQQRGWQYGLQGAFDSCNTPTVELPQWDLAAEFFVEAVLDGDGVLSPAGMCLYISTDQVRFTRLQDHARLPLTEVPALVFSEVMRDVDLFVGVCSIGNDPNWLDSGPNRYRAYWQSFSFGDLSASAQTRRSLLERLVPRLKIASRCSLTDKFLVVRGDLRTYKIHLGSGNILMEPNDQYLCIVMDRGPGVAGKSGDLFLPFEGDATLALILSKAFILADDRSIKDPSITRQINVNQRPH